MAEGADGIAPPEEGACSGAMYYDIASARDEEDEEEEDDDEDEDLRDEGSVDLEIVFGLVRSREARTQSAHFLP